MYDTNGSRTRTYLAPNRLPRYTRTGTGVLWHPRSQTRPESYRVYLICYNIRRKGTKRGAVRANKNREDIGNVTNVDKAFKGNAGWELKEMWNAAYDYRRRKRAGI